MSSKSDAVTSTKPSSAKVSSSSSTTRPSLKNLTRARVPRAGMIGCGIAVVSAVAWKVLISDRHKNEMAAFYKTYDPERDYARMKAAGVFKSLEGRERPEWLSEYESELDSAIESIRSTTKSE
ncbi:unnamed protein product [Adineta steineri]|uniref:Mitochondrial cytochrome c oxidase subunit VIc/VIIs domain-containing protein n=3 Tax=Adineta steineri TaxID=433720 RepID=A0A818ZGR4_9BILA|nr:unnamed protein product [Adineta steineri]CAF3584315.1 unnamed protein product [Adineta steineri]CAF3768855.1 unnamed protein product [Adineta steineri]